MMQRVNMSNQGEDGDALAEQEILSEDAEENDDNEEEEEKEEEEEDVYGEIVRCWQVLPLDLISGFI